MQADERPVDCSVCRDERWLTATESRVITTVAGQRIRETAMIPCPTCRTALLYELFPPVVWSTEP